MFARPRRELIRAGRDATALRFLPPARRRRGVPVSRTGGHAVALGELQLLVSATAWWRERKGDVAKGRQARYRRSIADSETRHPPGNCGQRSVAVFRDGFRWQLIGTERNKEARHERISDRDLDHRCSCRRRARRLAGQRGAGGAQVVPGTRARERLRGTVQGGMHVGAGRSVAPRRDEPVAPGRSLPGTRFSRARKIPPTRNPGTPGRARGARWIGNNGTGPLVPATGRTSAAAGGKS